MRTLSKILAATGLLVAASTVTFAGEGRTPIYAPGTVITKSGRYILTRNITGTGTTVIQINAQSVDLDLNGFVVDGALATGIQVLNANDVRIHHGVVQNCGPGVLVTSAVQVALEDLRILNAQAYGIKLDAGNSWAIRRVSISGTNPGTDGIFINTGIVTTGRIESCQLLGGGGRGIYLNNGNAVTIKDNTIMTMAGEGIYLDGCDGCLIKENTVARTSGQGGIYLAFAAGTTLTRNMVADNVSHGIHLASATRGIVVESNVMQENGSGGSGDGLRVGGLMGSIVGNTMTGNNGVGLHFLSTSNGATMGRNTARLNTGAGGGPCTGTPTLFYPNSCNEAASGPESFGDNLIPAPLY